MRQVDDLRALLLKNGFGQNNDLDLVVETENMTFQAHSGVAQSQIAELVWRKVLFDDHSEYGVVAGVFPAHVAVAISQLGVGVPVFVPVSVPAPAAEGETRGGGFVHSHWEKIT